MMFSWHYLPRTFFFIVIIFRFNFCWCIFMSSIAMALLWWIMKSNLQIPTGDGFWIQFNNNDLKTLTKSKWISWKNQLLNLLFNRISNVRAFYNFCVLELALNWIKIILTLWRDHDKWIFFSFINFHIPHIFKSENLFFQLNLISFNIWRNSL
mgnify:CR=1 FL=1